MQIDIPQPNPKQIQFLSDNHKFLCYGGARGGGKSWVVRVKALLLCHGEEKVTVTIVRRSYPELYENHIRPLLEFLPQGTYRYNDSRKEMIFSNGSLILFRFCGGDSDLPKFQGLQTDFLFIDEATQFTEHQFRVLTACVRGTNPNVYRRVFLTCNPGGIGHQFVRRLFIDRKYTSGENPDDYFFIGAGVRDNLALMQAQPEYIKQLEALPPKLRAAWLDGSWDILDGAFFEDFRNDVAHYDDHRFSHVINPFDIPKDWTIYRGLDWGYNKPASVGYFAFDYEGTMYHFLEWYLCSKEEADVGLRMTPDQVFKEMRKLESEHPWLKGKRIHGVADPAIWGTQTGESVYDTALKNGIYFSKGDNSRLNGWMQCHYRLQMDDNGYSRFYVFKNCENFIRTIPLLQYDPHKAEDLQTMSEDHIADMWRYVSMSRPIKPIKPQEQDTYEFNPLFTALHIQKGELSLPPEKITSDFNLVEVID